MVTVCVAIIADEDGELAGIHVYKDEATAIRKLAEGCRKIIADINEKRTLTGEELEAELPEDDAEAVYAYYDGRTSDYLELDANKEIEE